MEPGRDEKSGWHSVPSSCRTLLAPGYSPFYDLNSRVTGEEEKGEEKRRQADGSVSEGP